MSRLHVKKQSLIAVAGIVWLLAGLNVAQLGVRAAIGMRGVRGRAWVFHGSK